MRLIKELIHRRVPHIIGSYLIAVEDSIVIAKVINSRQPVYKVRKHDMIFISK
jgi:hypothetical protein